MNPKTEILCKYLGGSNLYGLNTASSDKDWRGVVIATDPSYIIGLNHFEEERKLDSENDLVLKEFQSFIRLLRKGNTEAFETLFAPDSSFDQLDKRFKMVRLHANDLIDSDKFYNSLSGYAFGEYHLAIGRRVGKLGGKRYESLQKYGFSPKNCTNLLRLLHTGIHFFKHDRYIVDCHEFGEDIYNKLFNIKTKPESYSASQMERDYKDLEKELDDSFLNRKVGHKFNSVIANWLIVQMYYPYLKAYHENES